MIVVVFAPMQITLLASEASKQVNCTCSRGSLLEFQNLLVMCVPFLRDGTLKKGAFSSPCLKEGTGKHPAETQELEARRMAHLRASRFCNKTLAVFCRSVNARKRKIKSFIKQRCNFT